MNDAHLKYSKDLDETIVKAIENDLKVKIISVAKIITGEFNYSYKIITDKGSVIARVFRERNSPEDGKLEWIEKKLTEHNIPQAKTLFLTREDKFFPYGYMVQEFVEGKNGFDSIMDGDITFEEYFNKLAPLLQKVHQISVQGYGSIHTGKGEFKTFYASKLNFIKKLRKRMEKFNDVNPSIHEAILKVVEKLKNYEHLFKPVLVHGDPPPGNGIITKSGELILIDWDNAGSGIWITEYAGLTYRGAYMWQHKLSEEERNEIIKRSFRNYYTDVNFDDLDLLEVVRLLQILTAYHSLAVHYFQHEDLKLYNIAKKRLTKMLKSFES